jgi:RNA polymerase sigma-70 factor, ECF subfamily
LRRFSSISGEELIRACSESSDSAAWEEFVFRFHRPISLSIIRTAYQWGEAPQQVVDDLVQETYLKLCANKCRLLLEFATRRPEAILAYIKTIAVNVAHDHFKSLHSQKRGSGEVSQVLEDAEPKAATSGLGGQKTIEQEVLLDQINQCLESCSQGQDRDRDCTIFWLYYQQGMSAKDIAALPAIGLSAKGIESVIFRLTRLVREQLVSFRPHKDSNSAPGGKGFLAAESY